VLEGSTQRFLSTKWIKGNKLCAQGFFETISY